MKTVLFLCTGNYFRSRFAEIFFNHLAVRRGLAWRSVSRGLIGCCPENIGPISTFAVQRLQQLRVPVDGKDRYPLEVTEADFQRADLIVAMKQSEHQPMLARLFPSWVDRVEYWHVDDLDVAAPEEALDAAQSAVTALIDRLAQQEWSAGRTAE